MMNHTIARTEAQPKTGRLTRESGGKANRRIGRIMHDERGNGFVQWEPAPEGYVRDPLEIVDDKVGFDPYNSGK